MRQSLISRNIVPEKVLPNEDIKKVERKIKGEEKKSFNEINKKDKIK